MLSSEPLKNEILKIDDKKNLEIEARFGFWVFDKYTEGKQNFKPTVKKVDFYNLMNEINLKDGFLKKDVILTETLNINDARYTYKGRNIRSRLSNMKTVWIEKKKIFSIDDREYLFRIAGSDEIQIVDDKEIGILKKLAPEHTRTLYRERYEIKSLNVYLDMTVVSIDTMSKREDDEENGATNLEVEIEMIDPEVKHVDKFMKSVELIARKMRGTHILYQNSEVLKLITKINSVIDPGYNGKNIRRQNITEPRNIKISDLKYKSIVGGKYEMNVSHKGDGKRMLLVVCEYGIWLVFSPSNYNFISREIVSKNLNILDGELIPLNRRRNDATTKEYWFQIIDTIVGQGENYSFSKKEGTKTLYYDFIFRQNFARSFVSGMKDKDLVPDCLHIDEKEFVVLKSINQTFDTIRKMYEKKKYLKYHEDGLIFTPTNTPYMMGTLNIGIRKRKLSSLPDIVKWKPPAKLTIDLLLRMISKDKPILYAADPENNGELIEFKGTDSIPFDVNTMLISDAEIIEKIRTYLVDVVIEYAWDTEKRKLYPVEIRHQKSRPNRLDVSQDIWANIHDPITIQNLLDEDFSLMYRYHNWIKRRNLLDNREIISKITENGDMQRVKKDYLLDIGSGNGGDVRKWGNYNTVILIEPDSSKWPELSRRIIDSGSASKVFLYNMKGEDYNNVVPLVMEKTKGQGVDVISVMNVMTFFWESKETLSGFAKTIRRSLKREGYVVWTAMNGDVVRQNLIPGLGGNQNPSIDISRTNIFGEEYKFKIKPSGINPVKGTFNRKIDIEMTGIVGKNTEYLTRFSDLDQLLPGYEIKLRKRATDEPFLSRESLRVTSFYSYGIWKSKTTTQKSDGIYDDSLIINISKEYEKKEIVQSKNKAEKKVNKMEKDFENMFDNDRVLDDGTLLSLEWNNGIKYQKLEFDTGVKDSSLVRLSTVGDGTCFLHAILTCISSEYRNLPDDNIKRRKEAINFRKNIAEKLMEVDTRYSSKDGAPYHYWETIERGGYVSAYSEDIVSYISSGNRSERFQEGVKSYSLNYLFTLFDSDEYLGDEIIGLVSHMLDIDIYIIKSKVSGISGVRAQVTKRQWRPTIIINYTGSHYEAVGMISKKGNVMTVFSSGKEKMSVRNPDGMHPLVVKMNILFRRDPLNFGELEAGDIQDLNFDPSVNYQNSFSSIFENTKDGDSMKKVIYYMMETSLVNSWGESLPNFFLEQFIKNNENFKVSDYQIPLSILNENPVTKGPIEYYMEECSIRAFQYYIKNMEDLDEKSKDKEGKFQNIKTKIESFRDERKRTANFKKLEIKREEWEDEKKQLMSEIEKERNKIISKNAIFLSRMISGYKNYIIYDRLIAMNPLDVKSKMEDIGVSNNDVKNLSLLKERLIRLDGIKNKYKEKGKLSSRINTYIFIRDVTGKYRSHTSGKNISRPLVSPWKIHRASIIRYFKQEEKNGHKFEKDEPTNVENEVDSIIREINIIVNRDDFSPMFENPDTYFDTVRDIKNGSLVFSEEYKKKVSSWVENYDKYKKGKPIVEKLLTNVKSIDESHGIEEVLRQLNSQIDKKKSENIKTGQLENLRKTITEFVQITEFEKRIFEKYIK